MFSIIFGFQVKILPFLIIMFTMIFEKKSCNPAINYPTDLNNKDYYYYYNYLNNKNKNIQERRDLFDDFFIEKGK